MNARPPLNLLIGYNAADSKTSHRSVWITCFYPTMRSASASQQ